jgi:iron-sulfur cluster insertion protein
VIQITESAAKQIKSILSEEDAAGSLRVFVQGGGCSGFQYGFSIEEQKEEDDLSFEQHGINVLIDVISMQYLNEATIDFKKDMTSSQFVVHNPNAKASCGCGSSFTV